jgi:hypothetical protein
MSNEQVFVSTVAILVGTLSILVAILNTEWCFRLPKARWVEARWGRRRARWAFALVGLLLVLLGVFIAAG